MRGTIAGEAVLRAIDGTEEKKKEYMSSPSVYSYKISVQIVKSVHNSKGREGAVLGEESNFSRARTAAVIRDACRIARSSFIIESFSVFSPPR